MNISRQNISGKCNLKCAYSFKYQESNCSINNVGSYLSIPYDKSSVPPVIFNNTKSLYILQDLFRYIIKIIEINKLYNTWKNDNTFNNLFIFINNFIKEYKMKYDTLNSMINISSFPKTIFKNEKIMWNKLDYLLQMLRDNDIVDF
jgi:hypothetical protein